MQDSKTQTLKQLAQAYLILEQKQAEIASQLTAIDEIMRLHRNMMYTTFGQFGDFYFDREIWQLRQMSMNNDIRISHIKIKVLDTTE